ncbi:MAG: PQQ-binding-like beta-propeller repeat protein [Saprospiraceae bacterium]|nr:PQQ-binding-like beta-propeller repeat protein [Saprospiraceae bacterium]
MLKMEMNVTSICRAPLQFILFICIFFNSCIESKHKNVDWLAYNGGDDCNHYSEADEINKENVDQLKVAWIYESEGADTVHHSTQMQCNPIIIDGILYGVSAGSQAFAISAQTGKEIWKTAITEPTFTMTSRGITYWSNGAESRIFFGYGAYLYALDAKTGTIIKSFGKEGKIHLIEGIERAGADAYVVANTPPIVFENILIVGGRVSESAAALKGDIRAYDVITGKSLWTFHTIPHPGEFGYETWEKDNYKNTGGANNWMGMALDRERGIAYVPTGSAAFDFYGGNRKGDNLFANSLLALDVRTGKRLWHFQTVHHDIWDRDIPAPPNLYSIQQNGKKLDVVSVVTKQGYIFVFDRVTGQPIYPIEEKSFPVSTIPGEQTSETQPVPLLPEHFTRQSFTHEDINDFASNKEEIIAQLKQTNTGSPFIPLGFNRTVFYPGTDGGAQWGGAAVDKNAVIYVPAKENPVFSSLKASDPKAGNMGNTTGKKLYENWCMSCHGAHAEGNEDGTYPSLQKLDLKYVDYEVATLLKRGRGRMPAFTNLTSEEIKAIYDYLIGKGGEVVQTSKSELSSAPYSATGYNRWYDSAGYPISQPPWGTLTATDMNTGKRIWQVPLGEYPELMAKGLPATGTDNYGGPAVTAGGILFIAATKDQKIRAFDTKTGKILWQSDLPAAGYASPSIYMIDGKQYVVIACGGGKLKTKSGDQYVAFALP